MQTISPFSQVIFIITIVVLLLTVFSALRHKIIFKMSLRNASRRKGTTLLVVLGSLVGTALITGSQIINDSFEYTGQIAIEESLGAIDATIENIPAQSSFPTENSQELLTDLKESDEIADAQFINAVSVSIQKKIDDGGAELKGQISALSGNWEELNKFGDSSYNEQIVEPGIGNLAILRSIAESLDIEEGDKVSIFFNNESYDFNVEYLIESLGVSGYRRTEDSGNLIINSSDFTEIFKNTHSNTILISNRGEVMLSEEYDGAEFTESISTIIDDSSLEEGTYKISERKEALEDQVTGSGMGVIFSALSIFGIFAGSLLIINIYTMLADERKSEMGMLRAIAFSRSDLVRAYSYEGFVYSIVSSISGVLVGIGIGYALIAVISYIINTLLSNFGVDAKILFDVTTTTLLLSFSLGLLITYITVFVASIFISKINIVSAIRDTEAEPQRQSTLRKFLKYSFTTVSFFIGLGIYSVADKIQTQILEKGNEITIDGFLWFFGFTMVVISAGFLIKWITYKLTTREKRVVINRILYTIVSISIFAYSIYALSADKFSTIINENPMYLFVVGIGLIISLTILLTFNLDIIVSIIKILFSSFQKTVAVIKIALRYPASNPTRTGLTLVMYGLIIFIVIFVSINQSTLNQLLDDNKDGMLGGFDGLVIPSQNEKTDEIVIVLQENEDINEIYMGESLSVSFPKEEIDTTDSFSGPGIHEEVTPETSITTGYSDILFAGDDNYFDTTDFEFGTRANRLEDDNAVIEEIKTNSEAVILSSKYSMGFPGTPVWEVGDIIEMQYPQSEVLYEKEVIAILAQGLAPDLPYGSILISYDALESEIPERSDSVSSTQILFTFEDGINTGDASKSLKEELARLNEFNIIIAEELVAIMQAFINQFIYLMQGFLSFGLLVGLAGLAVILTRSVNERRQQIGMLRSLGFKKSMILYSFLLEASLIGLLGIFIGVTTGTIAGVQLINAGEEGEKLAVSYPTREVIILSIVIYIATLLFAALPAIKASRLEPIEATNYPE